MLGTKHLFRNFKSTFSRAKLVSAKADLPLVDVAIDDGGTALVTMQRAPVNSLNLQMLQALSNAFDEVDKSKCKAMILTSALSTVYCAGFDVTEMCKPDVKRLDIFWTTLQDVWLKLYGSSFVTAAAINGHAPAGGCLLALACEYRTMVNGNYTIGFNETTLGLLVSKFLVDSLLNTISNRQSEMAVTVGKLFSVDEALKVGLIDDVATDKDDAIGNCRRFIKLLNKVSPGARAHAKQMIRGPALQWLADNRQQDKEMFMNRVLDPEVQNIIEVYLESLKHKRSKCIIRNK